MRGTRSFFRGRQQLCVRRAGGVAVLVLLAVMLSACVEVNQRSTIGTDFTGTTEIRLGISKQALALVGTVGTSLGSPAPKTTPAASQDPFADSKKQVAQLGGTSKDYQNDKFQGIDASLKFKSLEEMQTQINTLLASNGSLNQTTGPTSSSSSSDSQSDLVKITAKATANGVRIDGTVDPLSTLNDTSSSTAVPGLDPKLFGGADGYVALAFTMPGKITSADPLAKKDKSTVSWAFKAGDKPATIFVESDKSGGQGGNAIAVAATPAAGTNATTVPGRATTASGARGTLPAAAGTVTTAADDGGSNNLPIILSVLGLVIVVGGVVGFLVLRGRGKRPPTAPPAGGYPATQQYGGQQPPQYGAPPNQYGQPPQGGGYPPPGQGYGQPPQQPYSAPYPPPGQQPPPPLQGGPPYGGGYAPPGQQPTGGGYPPSYPPQSGPYGQPPQQPPGGGYGAPPQQPPR